MLLGLGLGLFDRAPIALISPKNIAGLAAWWCADHGMTLNAGSVAAWADQSGNGHDLTQATGSHQAPLVAADANFNGQASVDFTGVTKWLTVALAIAQPFSIFAVARNTVGNGSWLLDSNSGGECGISESAGAAPGSTRIYAGSFGTAVAGGLLNTTGVVVGIFDSANVNSKIALSANTPAAGESIGTNGLSSLIVGGFQGGGGGGYYLADLAIYDHALSLSEIAQLNAYAKARYALTIGA